MWYEDPGMTKLLYNTLENIMKYKVTENRRSEEPDRVEVRFKT